MRPVQLPSRRSAGLVLGPAAFVGLWAGAPFDLQPDALIVLASTAWIVCWWVTEAVPIPVTSLLPVVLFPATGVTSVASATAPYADPIVFLLLGGFLVALAIERWNLHHRLSLLVVAAAGTTANRLVFGFMFATAFLSMWISNTATAMLMVPIGTAVTVELTVIGGRTSPPLDREDVLEPNDPLAVAGEIVHPVGDDPESLPNTSFGLAVLLGIAYGASIGGAATLVGSPPNAVLAGVAESSLGIDVGFLEWMLVGVPLSALMLVIAWAVLVLALRPTVDRQPGREDVVRRQLEALGPLTTGERRVLAVFGLVAAGWILRPFVLDQFLPGVTDAVIAIVGAVLVFVVPVEGERLLDWEYATRVPWGCCCSSGRASRSPAPSRTRVSTPSSPTPSRASERPRSRRRYWCSRRRSSS